MKKESTYLLFISILLAFSLCSLPSFSQDRGDTPLRLAVAGTTHGHLGEVATRIGRGDFEVVGVAEPNEKYLHDNVLVGKVPADRFYTDLGKMLDETKPEVVVAYGSILSHMEVVEACAPRHIHVMVEKPLATTYKQARKMEALARKYGIMVLTNYETSWYSTNHEVKRLVEEGSIGRIDRINVYDGHEGPREIGCDEKFLEWLTDPILNGGGAVIDFGCYGANLATWLLDGKAPQSVYAVLQRNKPQVYPKVDDDATIVLSYPGTTVQIMGSWCWPTGRKDMYVYGERGYYYQRTGNRMSGLVAGKPVPEYTATPLKAPYDDSFRYLKAVVRGEITLSPKDLASLENNILVVRILDSAIKSAKTGKAVKLK